MYLTVRVRGVLAIIKHGEGVRTAGDPLMKAKILRNMETIIIGVIQGSGWASESIHTMDITVGCKQKSLLLKIGRTVITPHWMLKGQILNGQ